MKLGVIADDFTGAVDIAGFLAKEGLRTVLCFGIDSRPDGLRCDAVVVCLKIRSCPVTDAVSQALSALAMLRSAGCSVFYYKYCSTFDCTPQGNIGQVCDALRQALSCPMTVVCPALPVNGRTVYNGYLFVKELLLAESPMRFHPMNPMWESRIDRILSTQTDGRCRNLPLAILRGGVAAVEAFLAGAVSDGVAYVIPDVVDDSDLDVLARACGTLPLLTGGSGLGGALARLYPAVEPPATEPTITEPTITEPTITEPATTEPATTEPATTEPTITEPTITEPATTEPAADGGTFACSRRRRGVVFSGSCSIATNRQVRTYLAQAPSIAVDVARVLADVKKYAAEIADWVCLHQTKEKFPLVFSTCDADVKVEGAGFQRDSSVSEAIEEFFALLAVMLDRRDTGAFIIAGGETSSAVVQALRLAPCSVVMEIDPGISWIVDADANHYLALKSGNFGCEDFFSKAQALLTSDRQGDSV